MTFFTIVARGLWRRPVRTGLTLVGISIGIAAVVALVGISRGFKKSWESGLKARGTDIVVSNMGGAMTPKPFNVAVKERIAKLPLIDATSDLYVELMSVEDSKMMMVSAREWDSFTWSNLKVISGRLPKDAKEPAVVLGQTAAKGMNKKVGDPIQMEAAELTVVGIVNGGALVEDGSLMLSLPLFQDISGNNDKINIIDIRVKPGSTEAQIKSLCNDINKLVPEVHAVSVSDHLTDSQAYKMVEAMSWGTSLLALLVGVLGVMNTMLMTVFERTHEICVLLALGWKRSRIVKMVLLESALLGLLGGLAGVAIGLVGVKLMTKAPAIRGLLEPDLSANLMLTSVFISILVGVVSGLYPAWRSSRLSPSRALYG